MNLGPLLIVQQDISKPDRPASLDWDDRGFKNGTHGAKLKFHMTILADMIWLAIQ